MHVGLESHSDYTAIFMWGFNLTRTIHVGFESHSDYTAVFIWGLNLTRTVLLYSCVI